MNNPKVIAIYFGDNDFTTTLMKFLKALLEVGLDSYGDLTKEKTASLKNLRFFVACGANLITVISSKRVSPTIFLLYNIIMTIKEFKEKVFPNYKDDNFFSYIRVENDNNIQMDSVGDGSNLLFLDDGIFWDCAGDGYTSGEGFLSYEVLEEMINKFKKI